MLKYLLDQGVSPRVAEALREDGYLAIHVGEIGMAEAMDDKIAEYAATDGYVVITKDSDFSQYLYLTQAAQPSVIWIRSPLSEWGADATLAILTEVLLSHEEHLLKQPLMITVSAGRVPRIRRLPMNTNTGE